MSGEPKSAVETVDSLEELADAQEKVCLGDVLDKFGKRSFGPFMMIPALLEITPFGAIPGVPTALAAFIALVAAQLLWGADHVWVPRFVETRAIKSDKLMRGAEKLEGLAEKLDHWFKGRMKAFTGLVWQKIAAVAIILLCLTVPPLELVPFASTLPMVTIAAFALALMVKDGLLMLIATILSVAALAGGTYLFYTSDGSILPF